MKKDGKTENRLQANALESFRRCTQDGAVNSQLVLQARQQSAAIDWTGIGTVLLTGQLFGDKMPFEKIYAKGTEQKIPDKEFTYSDITDLYTVYNDLIDSVVKKIPEDISSVMGISGGRDSRSILLSIDRNEKRIPGLVTSKHFVDRLREADVEIALTLSSRFNANIQVVEQPTDRFRLEWNKNIKTGMQTLSHSWGLAFADVLDDSDVLYDGMNGGVLFGRANLLRRYLRKHGSHRPRKNEFVEFVLTHLVDTPLKKMEWLPDNLFGKSVIEEIRENIKACAELYVDYPNPFQAFLYGEHVYRDTRLFTYGLMPNEYVVCPLDSGEMVQFALSLPWEVSSDYFFQNHAINYRHPDFADIPFTEQLDEKTQSWHPDEKNESESWQKIRKIIQPEISQQGIDYLDQNYATLGIIQQTALLAQAYCWEKYGDIPEFSFFQEKNNLYPP